MANKKNTTSNSKEITLTEIFDLCKSIDSRVSALEEAVKDLTASPAPAPASKPAKASTSKKSGKGKKSAKSDDFDRDTYVATAKELGCLGKHGVWKGCREFVYSVMDGEMTVKQGKAKVKAWVEKQGW